MVVSTSLAVLTVYGLVNYSMPFAKKNSFSVKSNIIAYIHTNRIRKYLSVRTKRSQFPRFFLLVPNSQERSSPRKLRPLDVKSWLGSPPSHLAEEISAGLCDRETHIHRNSDIYMQFKEVHWEQSQTIRRCSINTPFRSVYPQGIPHKKTRPGYRTDPRVLQPN